MSIRLPERFFVYMDVFCKWMFFKRYVLCFWVFYALFCIRGLPVRRYAYEILKTDCASKSKTKDLSYPKFELQQYLKVLPPKIAQTICQARSKTLEIKAHTPFLFNSQLCRVCGVVDESLNHILNCHQNFGMEVDDVLHSSNNFPLLKRIADTIHNFYDSIPDGNE